MKTKLLLTMVIFITIISTSIIVNAADATTIDYTTNLNVVVSDDYDNWGSTDRKHVESLLETVSTQSLISTLIQECAQFSNAINELDKTAYVTKTNVSVFHPITTAKITLMQNAIYQRQKLLTMIKDNNDTSDYNYDASQFVDALQYSDYYIDEKIYHSVDFMTSYLNDTVAILESGILPADLLYGLKIYIAPYKFAQRNYISKSVYSTVGIGGYISDVHIKGKEEVIIFSMSNMSYLIHELGHAYIDELLGFCSDPKTNGYFIHNADLWTKYSNIYNESKFDFEKGTIDSSTRTWESSIYENCAEDFKCYYSKKLTAIKQLSEQTMTILETTGKTTDIKYKGSEFSTFIESLPINGFDLNPSYPDVTMSLYNMAQSRIYLNNNGFNKVTVDNKVTVRLTNNDRAVMKVIYLMVKRPGMTGMEVINFTDNMADVTTAQAGTYEINFVIQTPTGIPYIVNMQTINKL